MIQIELTLEELDVACNGLNALLVAMMDSKHARPGSKKWNDQIGLVVGTLNKLNLVQLEHREPWTESRNHWRRVAG